MDEIKLMFLVLAIICAVVGGFLLHAMMQLEHLKTQPPPLWLYGMHEDGTPIKGWHDKEKNHG